eukprot:1499096-Amphidinium_carterae.1
MEGWWGHFYQKHMDKKNTQVAIARLTKRWRSIAQEDRESALGWLRDAGQRFKYDVQEALGKTSLENRMASSRNLRYLEIGHLGS